MQSRLPQPPQRKFCAAWLTLATLMIAVLTFAARAEEPESLSPVVTIGVVADNEPYTFFEGRNPAGFSIDVLREVASNSNLVFDFRAGSWPDIYAAFLRGDLDAIDGISWRPDRAEKVLFSEPYHYREIYLMHDSARPTPTIEALDDLQGLRVGMVEDIFYRTEFADAGISLTTYDSLTSVVRALAFGWIDIAVGPKLTMEYLANQAGFRFLELLGPAPLQQYSGEDFRIGVLTDNLNLFNQIQAGLNAVPEEKLQHLLQRWQEFGGLTGSAGTELALSSQQRQYLASLGPVRIGFMDDYAPFSFTDGGRVRGLSVDIMNRLVDLTGLQAIPVSGQWDELIPMLKNGDIDVMANMSHRPERESFAHFTSPYHIIPNVIFTRDESLNYRNLEDLKHYRVGLGAGIYYEETLRQLLSNGTLLSFHSQQPMFQALASGDVDVVIGALHSGNYWIRQLGISGTRIAGELQLPGFSGEDLRFGVRPALAPLADILNQALTSITPTEQQVIETRWLGASNQPSLNTAELVHWTDTESLWLEQRNREIRICADPDWMPLEGVRDGKHTGLAADVLELFSQRGNLRFRLVPTSNWQEAIAAAKDRRCDMFPMAMRTPERSVYLDFTSPYLEVPNVVIGRIEAPFIQRLNELEGGRVGIVEGYAFAELLRKRNPSLQLVTVESEQEGLRKLQNRELIGYVTTLATASYYMQSMGLADLKVIGRVPADWSLAIGTRNDEPTLHGIMQKLVLSLTPAERTQLESTWRNLRIEERVDYTRFWQILSLGLLATALLVYWNRKLGRLNRELAEANTALSRLSVTDNLTGLGNRTYFDREFSNSFQWCLRHQTGFAVAMVDADHFKKINDNWGHEAGDRCLESLANTMREHFRRDTDRLARFGGEEFVIFASYQDADDIKARLNRFREEVATRRCDTCKDKGIDLTVSIGLALGFPTPEHTSAEYLRLADQALYTAKRNGRNRLEVIPAGQTSGPDEAEHPKA
ncbi:MULTISPECIES: transporter substrate-binding domain-containing protein [unclassified Marinobacter]|uniref:transporter substrate-binding domain-containing diguanylate cyclase n=1 Tax=unclassified Marinobacter TaxID=83889 RepID=UPI0012AA3E12|nr:MULTISPECIES: transporter substrate-binding domain-containing protein [unclassified Marinobacter]QFS88784.1 Virulence sensor protein BvgS precursor [Marinobacter sp. THAF197a]QFT52569.1 Virulence sensor protein BvgS precursor [Marinobacter sp. THAF39]